MNRTKAWVKGFFVLRAAPSALMMVCAGFPDLTVGAIIKRSFGPLKCIRPTVGAIAGRLFEALKGAGLRFQLRPASRPDGRIH